MIESKIMSLNCENWLVMALCIFACNEPQAQNQITQLTTSGNSRYESLCQQLADVRQEKQVNTINYCGVNIPSSDNAFTLPEWVNIDPEANMNIVQAMYYWYSFGGGTYGTQIYKDQLKDLGTISPDLLALYWPKAEGQIMTFIEQGEVTLQSSSFDIDGDYVNERVYRMTPIVRLGGAAPPLEQDPHQLRVRSECSDFGLPGGDKRFIYYSPPSELPTPNFGNMIIPFHLKINGFFKWNGESFFVVGPGLMRAAVDGEYTAAQICNIIRNG